MKITVIGSTCETSEALKFCGHAAGVCYMPDDFEAIKNEPLEKTLKRAYRTLKSGHHSVYDHVYYNLLIEDIPKILAMVLNNEGVYTTSEKSARYTKMNLTTNEQMLYDKWLLKISTMIQDMYGDKFLKFYKTTEKADKEIEKLAMENARYVTSIFTPTTMIYTVSLRQINYIVDMFFRFSSNGLPSDFYDKLRNEMKNFIIALPKDLIVPDLSCSNKNKVLSLFNSQNLSDGKYYSDVYNTNSEVSFACLAQMQRHRTLHYNLKFLEQPKIHVPHILPENLYSEWHEDLLTLKELYPQAYNIRVYERGTYENFLLKCYERMCGRAQLEVMIDTKIKLFEYNNCRPDLIGDEFLKGARCNYLCFKCENPCVWGAKDGICRYV